MTTYKQWQLPNNSKVLLPNGKFATFLKMDGMYAQWTDENGKFAIGNYNLFEKVDDYYKISDKDTQ